MKVSLIEYTGSPNLWAAAELLIFTKSTRLTLSPGLMDEIRSWPAAKKMDELLYIAKTVPSSWEFIDYTFLIEGVSRAFTHQFVRTRNGSYAQQTMRVLNMGGYEYVATDRNQADPVAMAILARANRSIQDAYNELIAAGQPVEDARGILPTNIATNIVAKFNLRTLSELAKSRTGGRTQGEYRTVMSEMAEAVLRVHPWAEAFLFPQGRDRYKEIEAFAEREFGGDLLKKGQLLKIVDQMRKEP
jgi:flavin-dependent thymidylate synthase